MCAFFGAWLTAVALFGAVSKVTFVALAILMVAIVIGPMVFAFGSASLLARFPATVRPLAQGESLTLIIWLVGAGVAYGFEGVIPEPILEAVFLIFLIGGFAIPTLALFGYGPLGRRLRSHLINGLHHPAACGTLDRSTLDDYSLVSRLWRPHRSRRRFDSCTARHPFNTRPDLARWRTVRNTERACH